MKEHVAKLRQEAAQLEQKAARLEWLLEKYPDLKRMESRWKREYFYSAQVNSVATEFESSHSCGCCADAPLLIKPYVQEGDMRIYSDPPELMVGEKDAYTYGDTLYPEWRKKLQDAGLSETIIDRVQHLGKCCSDDLLEETDS